MSSSVNAGKLAASDKIWNWTISLEDSKGKSYIAGGTIDLVSKLPDSDIPQRSIGERPDPPSGYILSSKPDFSQGKTLFGANEIIYLKAWSDELEYRSIKDAVWTLMSASAISSSTANTS